jgi:hypothetical protein
MRRRKAKTQFACEFASGMENTERVDDFDEALPRARALVSALEQEPQVNPATGTREFALWDPDGYYVMVSALD